MRVVTGLTLTLLDRTMEKLFAFQILFDVAQRWSAHIVFIMAVQAGSHLIEREQPFVLGIVGGVAGSTPPLLPQWFVRHLYPGQLLADITMALNAEIRQFLLEHLRYRRSVRVVAGGAGAFFDWRMGNRRFFQSLGKIGVTFQTQIPNRDIKEGLFCRFMGVVTFCTGANGNGTVHELLLERGAVMTAEAQFSPIVTHIEQIPAGAAVGLVAAETVTFLDRWVHHLFLAKIVVTL